jgi:hypothetical protein
MPIIANKLGPGTLTLGIGPLAVEQQLTGCKLVPSETVETEDAIKVLSGDELAETSTESYSWTLQGEFLQDLNTAGVVAWSWTNKGTEQAFVYEPNDGGSSFTGTLKPVPLQVGGDEVGKRMLSTFTWRVVGDPTPDWV